MPMVEIRRLDSNPNVRIYVKFEGFNPTNSFNDRMMGFGSLLDGYVPPILDLSKLDGCEFAKDEDAFLMVKELADKEGIFVGISSGAIMNHVIKIARKMEKGVIVTLFPDSGWKYISECLDGQYVRRIKSVGARKESVWEKQNGVHWH